MLQLEWQESIFRRPCQNGPRGGFTGAMAGAAVLGAHVPEQTASLQGQGTTLAPVGGVSGCRGVRRDNVPRLY